MIPALLLAAWFLTFTAPIHNAGSPTDCNAQGVGFCTDADHYEVWWHGASAAAFVFADSLATPSGLDHYWPSVRTESAWQKYATYPAATAGFTVRIAMPDSLPLGRMYGVVTVDSTGNRSCMGNEVWR